MIRTRLAAVAAGVLASGTVMFAAAPAFATTPLTGCTPAASAPLYTTTCLPVVTGGTSAGAVTVNLPGVGTLTFTLKADGTIDPTVIPTATATGANFSAGTPVVSPDGTHISVTFVNAANPVQKYVIKAKVSQTNPTTVGGAPGFIVTAHAGPQTHHKSDQEGDKDDDDQGGKGGAALTSANTHQDHESSSGSQHEDSGGGDGNSQGGGGGD
jgi:hypothetical protein